MVMLAFFNHKQKQHFFLANFSFFVVKGGGIGFTPAAGRLDTFALPMFLFLDSGTLLEMVFSASSAAAPPFSSHPGDVTFRTLRLVFVAPRSTGGPAQCRVNFLIFPLPCYLTPTNVRSSDRVPASTSTMASDPGLDTPRPLTK